MSSGSNSTSSATDSSVSSGSTDSSTQSSSSESHYSNASSSGSSSGYASESGSEGSSVVEYPNRNMSWFSIRARQTGALMRKNLILARRHWLNTVLQLLLPAIFLLLLLILDLSFRGEFGNSGKDIRSYGPDGNLNIKKCEAKYVPSCYTFVYTHQGNPTVEALVDHIINAQSDLSRADVLGIPVPAGNTSAVALSEYASNNPGGVVQAGFSFNLQTATFPTNIIDYTIHFNSTEWKCERADFWKCDNKMRDVVVPLQVRMHNALMSVVNAKPNANLAPDFIPMAHPRYALVDIIQQNLAFWLLFAAMFPLIFQIQSLVTEKEEKLRLGMRMMGVKDAAYWVSWYAYYSILSVIVVFVTCAAGAAMQYRFFLNNDFGTYFFLLFLFGQCMVAWGFFFASILQSQKAGLVIGLLFFVVFGLFGALFNEFIYDNDSVGMGWKRFISIFPPNCFNKAIRDLAAATSSDSMPGLRWGSRYDNVTVFSLGTLYEWMIGDFFLYMFLAWYLDNVLPSANGTARPLWFLFTPSYWFGSHGSPSVAPELERADNQSGSSSEDVDVIAEHEAVRHRRWPSGKEPAVVLDNLSKMYYKYGRPVYQAVRGVSMYMEDQSVFCLLGPNGAGKTTTLSMLTGVLSVSGGDATFFGKSVHNSLDEIRANLGVCPQFDVLWPELSAGEHIELFATIKGLPKETIAREVEERLDDVDLLTEKDGLSGVFSGGMRRRLSLAIALTGSPPVVYLDEPTTGMDPVSRRKVWNVIEQNKRKRAILLTTHSMEEADTLGDRVAIVAYGRLRCIGSSLHLKQKYGAGYRIVVSFDKRNQGKKFVKNLSKEYSFIRGDVQSELQCTISIPPEEMDNVPEVIRYIDDNKEDFNVGDYILSLSTLEDVFLRIAREAEHQNKLASFGNKPYYSCPWDKCGEPLLSQNGQQVRCTHCNRMSQEQPNGRALALQMVTCPNCGGGSMVPGDAPGYECPHCHQQHRTPGHEDSASYESTTEGSSSVQQTTRKGKEFVGAKVTGGVQFGALMKKNYRLQKRQTCTNICQILIPALVLALLIVIETLVGSITVTRDADPYPVAKHAVNDVWPGVNCNANFDEEWMRIASEEGRFQRASPMSNFPCLTPSYTPQWLRDIPIINPAVGGALMTQYRDFTPASPSHTVFSDRQALQDEFFNKHTIFETNSDPITQSYLTAYEFRSIDPNAMTADYSIFFNRTDSAFYNILPGAIDNIHNALLKVAGISQTITTTLQPLPIVELKTEVDIPSIIILILLPFMLYFQFPLFLGNVMAEKEGRLIEIMKMMGLRKSYYWYSQFLFDFVLYTLVCLVTIVAGLAFSFRYFTAPGHIGVILFLFIAWGLNMIPMAFIFSNFFAKQRKATMLGYILVLFSHALGFVFMGLVDNAENDLYTFLFQLYPYWAFLRANTILAAAAQPTSSPLSLGNTGKATFPMVQLYLTAVVLFALVFYFDQVIAAGPGLRKPWCFCIDTLLGRNKNKAEHDIELMEMEAKDFVPLNEDEDVAAQRSLVHSHESEDLAIRILGIRKVFGNGKVAVNSASFGIEKGECFGLLGHNGAGKTTLVSMLTGLFPPTLGSASIMGYDITTEMDRIHSSIGVCPQHDLLWGDQTAREHLEFYAKLKHIPPASTAEEVEKSLNAVGLAHVGDKLSKTFSGGMKRRLSIAIALLGNPPVVFLDEPTTGLDPKSRRDVWDVITQTRMNDTAIILTTHSMEEAEALCTRLAIMSAGALQCIGTPTHLKSKFGSGYRLALTLDRDYLDSVDEVTEFVREVAPSASHMKESLGANHFYHLDEDDVDSLPQLFEQMQDGLAEHHITDWAVSQTTLDDVFVRLNEEE